VGALIMRLRGEGHGQLRVFGPHGTAAAVTSLQHFIHWQTPRVLLSELVQWDSPVVYEVGVGLCYIGMHTGGGRPL
jgi:hypothetical protein